MMTEQEPTNQYNDWKTAAARLFGDDITVRSESAHTVTHSGGAAQLRKWEPLATADRVTALRKLLDRVPEGAGVPRPVGNADAVVMIGGRVYDACSVIEGLPLNRHGVFAVEGYGDVAIPLHETASHGDMLIDAAKVLAHVHEATRNQPELAEAGHTSATELHAAVQANWQDARKRLGSHAESLTEVRRWLRCGNRVIPIAAERLELAGEVASGAPVLIHNNIWPAYLRVDAPSTPRVLHGITGWTSASAGSPVLDLAALSVRVTGWSGATVESILGAYNDHAELAPAARRLVPVLAAVDLLNQIARLLEIAYLDDSIANDPAQPFIRGGIKVLLRSLEQITNVLAPPEPTTRRPSGYRSATGPDRRGPRGPRKQATGRSRRR